MLAALFCIPAFLLILGCTGPHPAAPLQFPAANASAQANLSPSNLTPSQPPPAFPASTIFHPPMRMVPQGQNTSLPGAASPLPLVPSLPPFPKTGLAAGNASSSAANASIPEEINFSNFTLVLDDLSVPSGASLQSCALLSVRTADGSVLSRLEACPGQDAYWTAPDGHSWRIVVYQTAPGYTHSAEWAEISIFG